MTADSNDYSRSDVEMIAAQFGLTIEQFVELGLPAPDYCVDGADYWREAPFHAWRDVFHLALATSEKASDPRRFREFVDLVNSLRKGGDDKDGGRS